MHLTLASILAESAFRHRDRVAVVEGVREATYGALWDEALRRAGALASRGVEPGDRVALLAANSIDFVTSYYAILARGGVVVPIPPMLVADEIAYLLADSGARVAIAQPAFDEVVRAAASGPGVAVLSPAELDALASGGGAPAQDAAVQREPLDPAVLFYTSGTTGRSKGAVLTQVNLVMNCFVNAFMANRFREDDVVLGCLPLFHTFGQTVTMNSTFLVGAKVILQPRFDGADALALIREHRVNVMIGVPTMYIGLLSALRPEDQAPPLRMAVCGGAPLPLAVLESFEARFGCRVQEGYGLSETSPTATVNQPELGMRAGSIGHPLWGIEVEIAAADVEDRIELLGPEELGEIVIRGHNVFQGYHELPEASAAALVDGWFRTGDLGVKDPDGFRYVVDRKKDMILRGGYNVYPREVEEVLIRHPRVAEVAVVGIPHPTHGEEVLAVVVPEQEAAGSAPLDPDELIAWSRDRVAHHRRPRLVVLTDELPLGRSRKVLKRELRERYAGLVDATDAPAS